MRSPSPTPALQARRLLLEAALAAARDELGSCSQLLLAALDLLIREAPVERHLVTAAVQELSLLSTDTVLDADAIVKLPTLLSRTAVVSLSPALSRITGWTCLLRGETKAALNAFVRQELTAVTPLERLSSCLDRTELAIFTDLREAGICSPTIALIEMFLSVVP
jgi:hypothetical protein